MTNTRVLHSTYTFTQQKPQTQTPHLQSDAQMYKIGLAKTQQRARHRPTTDHYAAAKVGAASTTLLREQTTPPPVPHKQWMLVIFITQALDAKRTTLVKNYQLSPPVTCVGGNV